MDIFHRIFIPVRLSYILGLYRNFIRRIHLLSNITILHVLDSPAHGILSRRDFGTWNSSSRDFGRSVWRALCAIGFQIHRAHASHVLGLSRNCLLPCIYCPGPVDRKNISNQGLQLNEIHTIYLMSLKSLTCCDSLSYFIDQDFLFYSFYIFHPSQICQPKKSQAHGILFNCYFQKHQIFGILTHGLAGGS